MKLGELNTKYHLLVKEKLWSEAAEVCKIIRNEYPSLLFGYINGGICMKELGRYVDAAILWSMMPEKRSLNALCSILGREELSNIQFEFIMEILLKEEFTYNHSTSLVDKLYHENGINSELYISMLSYLNDNYQRINEYTLLSIGKHENPKDMLIKIYESGDLDLIRRVLSSHENHIENINCIQKHFEKIQHNNVCIKNSFLSSFRIKEYKKAVNPSKKLKIAVCVSGQVRGFEEAFKSWNKIFKSDHQFDFYCSFWDEVGRKPVTKPHLYRHFNNDFIKLFLKDIDGLSNLQIEEKYDALYGMFKNKTSLNEKLVRDVYKPLKLNVYNTNSFKGKSGMYCMHFLIEECFNAIDNLEEYDLVVRFRADKSIKSANICWNSIYEDCLNNTVYCNGSPEVTPGVGFVIGDQFAVSTPELMSKYSHTYTNVKAEIPPFDVYKGFRPHMSLALSLLSNNINVKSVSPEYIRWGELLDPEKFSEFEIYQSILRCNLDDRMKNRYAVALNIKE